MRWHVSQTGQRCVRPLQARHRRREIVHWGFPSCPGRREETSIWQFACFPGPLAEHVVSPIDQTCKLPPGSCKFKSDWCQLFRCCLRFGPFGPRCSAKLDITGVLNGLFHLTPTSRFISQSGWMHQFTNQTICDNGWCVW